MLRNEIKNHWQREQLPIGSYIHAGGYEFKYEANETAYIDPDEVMKLYEEGELTREQFIELIKIDGTEAKKKLGGDQVADFTRTTVGSKVDVRISSLPVENEDDEFVMSAHKVKKKEKRRVFGGSSKPTKMKTTTRGKPKRRIKTKVSK